MSGPTTAILVADPLAVLLSAAAIRAAMAIQQGYEDSAILKAQHLEQRNEQLKQQQSAALQGQQALQERIAAADTEFEQLCLIAQRSGNDVRIKAERPVNAGADHGTATAANKALNNNELAAYLQAIQTYNAELKSILLTDAARQMSSTDEHLSAPEFLLANEQAAATNVQRLLQRIAHLGQAPDKIALLAQELASNLPLEREQLLLNELRHQIQLHLEQVQQQQLQEASALILRQSLIDLGYQVEEFSSTLFIEGGVAHFRRHDWGDYMVRLRINEANNTINFNVIRAVQQGNNERSVLDHLAEDRWCAEFPTLLKAMEARGLSMNVTRRLEAGELPVQLVNRDQLPQFTEQEQRRIEQPLLAREIK